jgi:hypothetical protein
VHLHSPVDRAPWARFPKVGPNGTHNGAQPARTLRGRRAAPRQLRAAAAAAALAERTGARLEKHLIILLVAAIAVRLERTLGMALRRLSLARRPHALLRPHAHHPDRLAVVQAAFETPSLYDEVLRLLAISQTLKGAAPVWDQRNSIYELSGFNRNSVLIKISTLKLSSRKIFYFRI